MSLEHLLQRLPKGLSLTFKNELYRTIVTLEIDFLGRDYKSHSLGDLNNGLKDLTFELEEALESEYLRCNTWVILAVESLLKDIYDYLK